MRVIFRGIFAIYLIQGGLYHFRGLLGYCCRLVLFSGN